MLQALETWNLGVHEGLDTVSLDHTTNIWVGEDGSREEISTLEGGGLVRSSEDGVELLECGLGPDNETTKVTARGEEQEVQGSDASHLNTSQISECPEGSDTLVGSDDEWPSLDFLCSVPQAGLAGVLGDVFASVDISTGLQLGQEGKSVLGLGEGLDHISNNHQGDLGNGGDVVSTGQNKGGDSRGGKGRRNSISLLVDVDLTVPPSPGTSGSVHSSTTAHVTEGSLACAVCTTTRNPRDTSHSSTSTPGCS